MTPRHRHWIENPLVSSNRTATIVRRTFALGMLAVVIGVGFLPVCHADRANGTVLVTDESPRVQRFACSLSAISSDGAASVPPLAPAGCVGARCAR